MVRMISRTYDDIPMSFLVDIDGETLWTPPNAEDKFIYGSNAKYSSMHVDRDILERMVEWWEQEIEDGDSQLELV